jgi:hypothetical protein
MNTGIVSPPTPLRLVLLASGPWGLQTSWPSRPGWSTRTLPKLLRPEIFMGPTSDSVAYMTYAYGPGHPGLDICHRIRPF